VIQGRPIMVHAIFQPLLVVDSIVRLATLSGALASSLHPIIPARTRPLICNHMAAHLDQVAPNLRGILICTVDPFPQDALSSRMRVLKPKAAEKGSAALHRSIRCPGSATSRQHWDPWCSPECQNPDVIRRQQEL
jgi:hypothetical protein